MPFPPPSQYSLKRASQFIFLNYCYFDHVQPGTEVQIYIYMFYLNQSLFRNTCQHMLNCKYSLKTFAEHKRTAGIGPASSTVCTVSMIRTFLVQFLGVQADSFHTRALLLILQPSTRDKHQLCHLDLRQYLKRSSKSEHTLAEICVPVFLLVLAGFSAPAEAQPGNAALLPTCLLASQQEC